MKPTDVLKQEHAEIKKMLSVLDEIIKLATLEKKIPVEDTSKILDFIKIFADRCHHGKEEDILFPSLENAGILRYGGPVGVMLMEHEQGRNYVKAMNGAVEKYIHGSPNALEEFVENARGYVSLLKQHIWKEDNILFNLADEHIPVQEQVKIMNEFRRFEEREIGEEHEKQLEILKQLEETYLKIERTENENR